MTISVIRETNREEVEMENFALFSDYAHFFKGKVGEVSQLKRVESITKIAIFIFDNYVVVQMLAEKVWCAAIYDFSTSMEKMGCLDRFDKGSIPFFNAIYQMLRDESPMWLGDYYLLLTELSVNFRALP